MRESMGAGVRHVRTGLVQRILYNPERLHSTLGYISPAEAENRYDAATAA